MEITGKTTQDISIHTSIHICIHIHSLATRPFKRLRIITMQIVGPKTYIMIQKILDVR